MPRALQHLHLRFALAAVLGLAWAGALTAFTPPALADGDTLSCPAIVTATDAGRILHVEARSL